ncbi:hypothetical protein GCM10010307_25350 [Streptomyces vastus]|uniref:Uncharacterized protein n=1 Tax=Streptomyces vastus TaxID=285451 RepID=A0ABN3QPZ2_9ACTN
MVPTGGLFSPYRVRVPGVEAGGASWNEAKPYEAKPGRLPAGTISRAPPDLSVLSQPRI